MTNHLQPSNRYMSYIADGVTTEFTIPYVVWASDDITVFVDNEQVSDSDYVVSQFGNVSGGKLTFVTAPASGAVVAIWGTMPRERDVDYNQYATLTADAMNLDQDVQEAQIQENTRDIKRCLISSVADGIPSASSVTLPSVEERKNSYFIWDGDGNPSYIPEIYRGHVIANQLQPFPYRTYLNFSDAFSVTDSIATNSTDIDLDMGLVNVGNGVPVVTQWLNSSVLQARTITGGANVIVSQGADGSVEINMASALQFEDDFVVADWSVTNTITYSPSEHGLGATGGLWAKCTDSDGWDVAVNVRCTDAGVVTIQCDRPFSGTVQIMGGYESGSSGMLNPFRAIGDLVYCSSSEKTPTRLPIGSEQQILSVDSGLPQWVTAGDACWVGTNVAGGAVLLDNSLMIPSQYLPYNTLTFKGTFGTLSSTTGGDLPTTGVLDGDIYVCVNEEGYTSAVAGITFDYGQWAVYDGTGWQAVAVPVASGKANVDASNLSDADVTSWREKLSIGGGLAGEVYSSLSNNTVYQAQTDVLVMASGDMANSNDVYSYIYVGDTASDVSTVIVQTKSNNKYGDISPVVAKVPRGKYFKVYFNKNFGKAFSIGL